jgi:predicted permease
VISARRFVAKLKNFFMRDHAELELAREVSSHLALLEDDFVRRGMTREDARLAARRAFGGVEQSKEQQREERSFVALEQIRQDLWFAVSTLVKQPVFTLAAVVSLGLGLGVNTAVFTLLNALIFRPLAVPNPQELVRIGSLENNGMTTPLPGPMLSELRKESGVRGVCGFTAGDSIVEIAGGSSVLATHSLTGDCYRTLGVRPALGRLLTPADDIPNGPNVATISYAFWKGNLGGNPGVLGQTIRIGGKPFQIVGVTEENFQGLLWGYTPSVSAPISQRTVPSEKDPSGHFYWADTLARLDPDTKPATLKAALQVKWRRFLDNALPATFKGTNRNELLSMPPVVTSAATGVDYYFRDHFRPSLTILLTVSVLLLVVSCFNVANILFARGCARQREMSIRVAVGAARGRLVQQLLTETGLLIIGGLAVAVALSLLTVRFVVQTFLQAYGRADFVINVPIDGRVLLFVGMAATVLLLLAGVTPAWQTSAVETAGAFEAYQPFSHRRICS